MRVPPLVIASLALLIPLGPAATAQGGRGALAPSDSAADPIKLAVARLDLERYRATVKGLTQFGDRRQGTKRNRDAVDWIEAQLKSYNCTPERIVYSYTQNPPRGRGAGADSVYVDPVTGDTVRTGRGRGRGRGA